jgi:GT2 family glycosyltransferase
MILSIIIVSFNTRTILKKCLESIRLGCQGIKGNWELIVVDNHSTDGSAEVIKNFKPKAGSYQFILNQTNLGFAKAVNQGAKKAKGEFILLMNSDIICQKSSITKLIDFGRKGKNLGLVGPKLLGPDNQPQASVFHLPSLGGAIKEFWLGQSGAFQKYLPQTEKPIRVEAVVGAVMLIPKSTIRRHDLLNENYFLYFEDLDYCRRLNRARLDIYYLPESEFIHYHGLSGKKMPEKVSQFLIASSQIYHGRFKHHLLTLIIRLGQLLKPSHESN